jgi:hypothetical protein
MLCLAQLPHNERAAAPGGGPRRVRPVVARLERLRDHRVRRRGPTEVNAGPVRTC